MKNKLFVMSCVLGVLLCGITFADPNDISIVGNVTPALAADWNSSTWGYIAGSGSGQIGSVTMINSSSLEASGMYVGNYNTSNGTLTMSGGSTLTMVGMLMIGGYDSAKTGKGTVNISGTGTKITNGSTSTTAIGRYGEGTMYITNGAQLQTGYLEMRKGTSSICSGFLKVDGAGSKAVSANYFSIGIGSSSGVVKSQVEVTNGGSIEIGTISSVGYGSGTNATLLVDGLGSTYSVAQELSVGRYGNGILTITNGGLVKAGTLAMNLYGTADNGAVRMGSNGQLALFGNGSANIAAFLGLIDPNGIGNDGTGTTDTIYYWNNSIADWAKIDTATAGVDYSLAAGTGNLTGYTVLTVIADDACSNPPAIDFSGEIVPDPICLWNSSTEGFIGHSGAGSVTMDAGDMLTALAVYVGAYTGGDGTLTMSGGSTMTAGGITAGYSTAVGSIALTGTGTTVNGGSSITNTIGFSGVGDLSIADGAQWQCGYFTAGRDAGSTGTVVIDGAGSTLTASTEARIGQSGVATLDVINGGTLTTGQFSVGFGATGANGVGEAVVSGVDSSIQTSGDFLVGRYNADGLLTIKYGGLVSVGGQLSLNYEGGNEAAVDISSDGKLALYGSASTIAEFLALLYSGGDTNINYWNGSAWDTIANATAGVDYTLTAGTGDLAGYTVLQVIVPGPCEYVIPGDVDGNCKVDLSDFAIMAQRWMLDCVYPNDLTEPACAAYLQ